MGCFISADGVYHVGDMIDGDIEVVERPSECCVYLDGEWVRGVDSTIVAVDNIRDSLIESGYTSGGYTYQIREIDIANFDRMLVAFNDGRVNPHGGQWATKDNVFVSLTDDEMKQLAIDATTYRDSILRARSTHVYSVSALTDEQASEYDTDTGWPVNGV